MDLKRILMELGNKLVLEHGYEPSGPMPENLRAGLQTDVSTEPITLFAEWLNANPDARRILAEMGVQWPMPE